MANMAIIYVTIFLQYSELEMQSGLHSVIR